MKTNTEFYTDEIDVTDDIQQLKYENNKLKINLSLLENESDEMLKDCKRKNEELLLENMKLKSDIGILKDVTILNALLKFNCQELENRIYETEICNSELLNEISILEEEVLSKNEIISIYIFGKTWCSLF